MITQNLNPKQLEAVESQNGPMLIIAGAGSGKTKTLTNRLCHLLNKGINPENIIAITFTNKAADEMVKRVSSLLGINQDFSKQKRLAGIPFVGTFHSLGARILRSESPKLNRGPNYTIYDADDSLSAIKRVLKRANLPKRESFGPSVFRHHISKIKSELIDPKDLDYENKRDLIEIIFNEYEAELERNNAFDFDDLIQKPVKLWQKNESILEKYQNKFKFVLVDEFQDVNTAQYEFVKLLAKNHRNINVVGDDAQAIYGFRSANYKHFLNFERDWPEAKIVLLEENYRSTSTIINAANAVIANNKSQKPKSLWTRNSKGSQIKIKENYNEGSESEWIISELKSGKENGKTAILYRTNAQSRAIEQALIESNLNYKIFGSIRFYDRKEIKDLVACLRYAANPKDAVSLERIQKGFYAKPYRELANELPEKARTLPPYELILYCLNISNYFEYLKKNYPNAEERIENIQQLLGFSETYSNLSDFLEKISLLQSSDNENAKNKTTKANDEEISLMTIHIAKGLEFDRVFVIGVNEGLLPHQMSYGTPEEVEEERRLMYVAMTRAKQNLLLSFYDLGSRFLYEIPPELIEFMSSENEGSDFIDDEERYISYD